MALVIKYIGRDIGYWEEIREEFLKNYSNLSPQFIYEDVTDDYSAVQGLIKSFKEKPQIIYLDYSYNTKQMIYLSKLMTRNSEFRLISCVTLHSLIAPKNEIKKALLAGIRISHYKGKDIEDIIYDPISLLDVNLAKNPDYIYAKKLPKAKVLQPLRVGAIGIDHYYVETDSRLDTSKFVSLSEHPLQDVMQSTRFFVRDESDQNLYYHKRFSYRLDFTFYDDEFMRGTEAHFFETLKSKKERKKLSKLQEKVFEDEIDKRRKLQLKHVEPVSQWFDEYQQDLVPKQVKVLVVDDTLSIYEQLEGYNQKLEFSINIQTNLSSNFYMIPRYMPDIIAIHFSKKMQVEEKLVEILKKIHELKNYRPYLLFFDCPDDLDTQKFHYDRLKFFKSNASLLEIESMAKILAQHKHNRSGKRVFPQTSNTLCYASIEHEIELIAMTESVLYIKSDLEIPMWTVFEMHYPAHMLITIVPHKEGGKFANQQGVYRSFIHATTESEKAKIRQEINSHID